MHTQIWLLGKPQRVMAVAILSQALQACKVILVNANPSRRGVASTRRLGCTPCRIPALASMHGLLSWSYRAVVSYKYLFEH